MHYVLIWNRVRVLWNTNYISCVRSYTYAHNIAKLAHYKRPSKRAIHAIERRDDENTETKSLIIFKHTWPELYRPVFDFTLYRQVTRAEAGTTTNAKHTHTQTLAHLLSSFRVIADSSDLIRKTQQQPNNSSIFCALSRWTITVRQTYAGKSNRQNIHNNK